MTPAKEKPKAPSHLSATSRKLWEEISHGWALDGHHYTILTLAYEALDLAEKCRKQVRKDGLMIETPHGRKPHPLLITERDARAAYAKLLRQLSLDDDDTGNTYSKFAKGRR